MDLPRAQSTAIGITRAEALRLILGTSLMAAAFSFGLSRQSHAQAAPGGPSPAATLFQNVRVFDGTSAVVTGPRNVLTTGNIIERISASPIAIAAALNATIIEGNGRVLMPGLTDAHWHAMLIRATPAALMANDVGYTTLQGAAEATATLMRGFTTVRDMGGPSFSLKRAIDEGLVVGPRIYPSGAMITITGGHGDFRSVSDLPRVLGAPPSRIEELGGAMIADSPDEVRLRAREQLLQGASQIKLTAGGGVASPFSPLDVATFTEPELRAAVEAAENWGTYVCTHAYTPVSIQRSIAAGVKCIEHGHLMDDATARMMAEKGIWLSTQPFLDGEGVAALGAEQQAKKQEVVAGTDNVYALAKKYGLKTAFGTDVLFSQARAERQGADLVALTRWYTPGEALIMATSTNAELFRMSGPRNPYPGKLGVVEEGAVADLLLVDGDPVADIALLADPATSLVVIMKDGKIYKNTLPPQRLFSDTSRGQRDTSHGEGRGPR